MDEDLQVTMKAWQWMYLLGFMEATSRPEESTTMTDIRITIARATRTPA